MMDTCLLRLREDGTAEWRAGACSGQGPLADAAPVARDRRLVVLVPGEHVLLADADIPGRRTADIERALPYALEEWLVEAPEAQHFAWTRRGAAVRAAVVAHERMQGWIDRLQEAGLEPQSMLPDALALPWIEGEWSLCLAGERALLRYGQSAAVTCPIDLVAVMLRGVYGQMPEADRPGQMRVWCDDDAEIPALPLETRHEPIPQRLVDLLRIDEVPLDLMNGRYVSRSRWGRRGRRVWQWAAMLAGAWLVTLFALQVARYVVLIQRRAQLQARIEQVFHRALPQEHRIVDARVQMQQALEKTQDEVPVGGALGLLADVSGPLAHASGVQIRHLAFRDGSLDITLSARHTRAFVALVSELKAHGLDAQSRDLDASGTVTTGHLHVEEHAP